MPSLISRLLGRAAPARPPEAKTSRVGPLLALHQVGRPVWTPRNLADLAREGYQRNPVVHRAVRMVAEAAASVPLYASDGDVERPDHPALALLSRPNPRDGAAAFLETLYGHLVLSGNAYAEAVTLEGVPRELYALRPDRMRVVPGADGWPLAWDYTVGASTVRFPRREAGVQPILHLTLFNPVDDHYGLSPIEAAANAVDVHNAAGAWNKALLDNSARPSGALVYESRQGLPLAEEQFERLKAELEQSFQGALNAGRPLLLEGGLDWRPLSLSPKDMDFVEAKHAAAREIALAFGVPPMLLGLPGDNTFANYAEANRSFWRQTVLPLVGRTAQSLAAWLAPDEPGLRLQPDLDRIDALAAERGELWSRIGAASFLTDDEKRAAVGYGAAVGPAVKYSPDQPRVPAGNGDPSGQWTSGGGGGGGVGGFALEAAPASNQAASVSKPKNELRDDRAPSNPLKAPSGSLVVNKITKTTIQVPQSYPPTFFVEKGHRAKSLIDNAQPDATAGWLSTVISDLANFRQHGAWDMQRIGGFFNPKYVDYATVSIGIYSAAAGMSEEQSLTVQNAYARAFSRFPAGTVMDEFYSNLPARNVENTRIGFRYYGEIQKQ